MRLILVAMALLVFAFMLPLVLVSMTADTADFRGIGIIVIGPFPIFLDTSDPRSAAFLLLPLFVIGSATLYLYAKTRKIQVRRE